MRSQICFIAVLGALSLLLVACGGDDDSDELAFVGAESHFIMRGNLADDVMDFTMANPTLPENLSCTREYEVPLVDGVPDYAQAEFVEAKINAVITLGDETRLAEIELKQHALDQDEVGDVVTIIPRVDGVDPAADEMWLEWEWKTLDDQDLFEAAAKEGTFTVELFSGESSQGTVIAEGEGALGGVINAKWSPTEQVQVSFSAPCTRNKIVEVE